MKSCEAGDGADPEATVARDGTGSTIGQRVALFWPQGVLVDPSAPGTGFAVQSSGRWVVRTRTSAYLVDLDNAVATRFPGPHPPCDITAAPLRRDGQDIPLEAVGAVVGDFMRMVVRVRDDATLTVRETTAVVAIDVVPHAPPMPPDRLE